MTLSQRQALVTLLADEDPEVGEAARRRLVQEGPGILTFLRPHVLSNDPVLRRRARQIWHHFEAEAADVRMIEFCRRGSEDLDLEEGMLRLSQTRYPDVNPDAYRALLDQWAQRLSDWLPDDPSKDDGILAAIHVVLFEEIGLKGNESEYYDPDNSYLNRVMDRRLGTPISLSAIVLLVGRRVGLPLVGIGLPSHFICRYQSPRRQVYLDPFHSGRLLDRGDCVTLVHEMGRPFEESFLQPVSSRRMLQRICVNLQRACETSERRAELARVKRYQSLLAGS